MSNGENQLNKIEHIVVLMFENRSFDNVLGWLYDPDNPPPFNQPPPANFDGLYGKTLTNPDPNGIPVPVGKTSAPTSPIPNPGEPYQDIYSQLYNVIPVPPLNEVPPNPPQPPGMQGFVCNYAVQPKVTSPGNIMNCLVPSAVSVHASLAYHYGVCDHWFASIPTQTFCNRSFVHAGTSSGFVNNGGDGLIFVNKTPTIFNLLEEAGLSWKIFHGSWLITTFALLTQERIWKYALDPHHFGHMHDFFESAKKPGGLPAYSFIEPIYFDSLIWGAENDMHPETNPIVLDGPSNAERGEQLLYTIYEALVNSPDWTSTLFIVLFDEHGGCYDHLPPPAAVPPDNIVIPPDQRGGSGFQFNRLGIRVPALLVSPLIPPQTILNTTFDHTAVLSTIVNRFQLPQGMLGARQTAMPDVGAALTLSTPRTDRPSIPQPSPVSRRLFQKKPLTELHRTALDGATNLLKKLGKTTRELKAEELKGIGFRAEADNLLQELDAHLRRG